MTLIPVEVELRIVRGRRLHVAHPHGYRPVTAVGLAQTANIRQRHGATILIELVHANGSDQARGKPNELCGLLLFRGTCLSAAILLENCGGLGCTTRSGHGLQRRKDR